MPEVDLAHLGDIDMLVRNAMNTAQGRDAFMKHVEQEGWLAKLVALVDKAESNQSITDLHNLCNIFKHLILFNNNNFIEDVVSDAMVMGVVGALECKLILETALLSVLMYTQMIQTFPNTKLTTDNILLIHPDSSKW